LCLKRKLCVALVAYLLTPVWHTKVTAMKFDWHKDRITDETPVTDTYRNTQNVRRFMIEACGPGFRFDQDFMAWVKDGESKTMGQVAGEWLRRHQP
jgi:hypothetical protein